jgi:hypothetical protein
MKGLRIAESILVFMRFNSAFTAIACLVIGLIHNDTIYIKACFLSMIIFALTSWFLSYMRGETVLNSSR